MVFIHTIVNRLFYTCFQVVAFSFNNYPDFLTLIMLACCLQFFLEDDVVIMLRG